MSGVASAFITWANPREIIEYEHDQHGDVVYNEDGSKKVLSSTPSYLAALSDQEICDLVLKMWCDSKPGRIGAVAYCVSETGFHHLHMVLEVENADSERFTYNQVQKIYGKKFHIEPTRGSKKEAEDYINKRGKYAEKGEKVLATAQVGELKGNQGQRTDLKHIQEMLEAGLTPEEIMGNSVSIRRYSGLIKSAYLNKLWSETPFYRDVKVIYHVGKSGSGKSYAATKMIAERGEDAVYVCTDYSSGFLDDYIGQPVLWMDEYRGSLPFGLFLSLLDRYKVRVHARYHNVMALWSEVHISSILPPETIYSNMVDRSDRKLDSIQQLFRRIDTIIYHYVNDDNSYCEYSLPMSDYVDYVTLAGLAAGECDKHGWFKASEYEQSVFSQRSFRF